ncbi:WYL domain-containing protein [Saccharopolyspora taberi]|uniref:WYL domain-containing protein n=1 Tax=Saccharopolyspora taberi TaxID=60895 RepID=A0ABN3V7I6_9PSEU
MISLVSLLQIRGTMTAAELARELEVSERTITRDVLALSAAGVPVYSERGRAGGYRLIEGHRSRLTGLHRAEAEALFLAGVPGPARDMGLSEAVAAARLKFSASLAPPFRDAPNRVGQRFHLDAPRWFREPETPPRLAEVARAVWGDLTIAAWYRRGEGEVRRELEPHGLVLKAGVWYLAARSGHRFLVYRVDRFTRVEVSEERFSRDETFDLPEFWERRAAEFARSLLTTRIVVRVTRPGLRKLQVVADRAALGEAVAGEPDEQGRTTVTLPVESLDVAYDQMLELGPEAEVLAPAALRERMAASAARLTDLYR